MGNTESVASGNHQRIQLKPSSSFSAQHRISIVDDDDGHLSPLDNMEVDTRRMEFFDENDDEGIGAPSSGDKLVARGSSFLTSRSKPRVWPKPSGSLSSNLVDDKHNDSRRDDSQRAEPISRVSSPLQTCGQTAHAQDNTAKNNDGKNQEHNTKTGTNDVVPKMKSNGREPNAARGINTNWGQKSRNMQNDLQIVQNVIEWNLRSKGRLAVQANGSKSDHHPIIPGRRPDVNLKVSSPTQVRHSNGRLPSSHGQTEDVGNGWPGTHHENRPFASCTTEAKSVESHGFSIQCESDKQSLEGDSGMFLSDLEQQCFSVKKSQPEKQCLSVKKTYSEQQCPSVKKTHSEQQCLSVKKSQPEQQCLSVKKTHSEQQFPSVKKSQPDQWCVPERKFSESSEPDHPSSSINSSMEFYTSAPKNESGSVRKSTRVPVESDDSFIPVSNGLRCHCPVGNPTSRTQPPEFGSTDIDLERFKDCFSFLTDKRSPDMSFGSHGPSVTSVGFNSPQSQNYSHSSQTFHNDTGQFDAISRESLDPRTSHSSAFSTSESGLSGSLSKPYGEISETTMSARPSDPCRWKSGQQSRNNITGQSHRGGFPSTNPQNSHDSENEQSCELVLPEQDSKTTENPEKEIANDPQITDNVAVQKRYEKATVLDDAVQKKYENTTVLVNAINLDVCSISARKNIASLADSASNINVTKTTNQSTVFPTALIPANANSSSSSSPSSSQLNRPDYKVTPRQMTTIWCQGPNKSSGKRKIRMADTSNVGIGNEGNDANISGHEDDQERANPPKNYATVSTQHGQRRVPPNHQPVEMEDEDSTAAAGGAELLTSYGFHVPLDDPGGAACVFLQPVPDNLSVSDRPGQPTFYAAYLLVAQEDIAEFGLPFLLELEAWGLSIFFQERDLVLTGYKYENLSAIVENRCNGKVIVVVSKNYPASPQCQYLTAFARNLDPDARRRNIIPVYIDKEIKGLPRVLKGLAMIRYNQVYRRGWLKDKIMGALSS